MFRQDGRIFIDRSGDLFAYLLQYLRTKQLPPQREIEQHKEALIAEYAPTLV